jgi:hypothetical protein
LLTGFNTLRDQGTEREQITCEVENENGTRFSLGVRQGSPDHRILFHALGRDWRGWQGTVTVTIAQGRNADVSFVNVKAADRGEPVWSGDGPPHPADQGDE